MPQEWPKKMAKRLVSIIYKEPFKARKEGTEEEERRKDSPTKTWAKDLKDISSMIRGWLMSTYKDVQRH